MRRSAYSRRFPYRLAENWRWRWCTIKPAGADYRSRISSQCGIPGIFRTASFNRMAATTTHPQFPQVAGLGNGPDVRALELAGRLQRLLPDTQVLLFGSRAIGDWRAGSDIDLAVIGGDSDEAEEALAQLYAAAPDDLPYAQLFHFTTAEFVELRTSLPHVAGQVQRYGLTPTGEHLPLMDQDNPWPGVQQRLQGCRRHLASALKDLGSEDLVGAVYNAQMSLEIALKAACGAAHRNFRNVPSDHILNGLVDLLPATQAAMVTELLPPGLLGQLTKFRHNSSYEGDLTIPWPSVEPQTVVALVQEASGRLAGWILDTMGKTPRQVGYAEWLSDGPLAGWESLPLDYYSQMEIEARAAQRATESTELAAVNRILRTVLTPQQMDRIGQVWTTGGLPADAVEQALAVRDDPSRWRTLLDAPADGHDATEQPPPARDDRPPPKGAW